MNIINLINPINPTSPVQNKSNTWEYILFFCMLFSFQHVLQVHLKFTESLLWASSFSNFKDIKPHCLAEGSAFSNSHNISNLYIPGSTVKSNITTVN